LALLAAALTACSAPPPQQNDDASSSTVTSLDAAPNAQDSAPAPDPVPEKIEPTARARPKVEFADFVGAEGCGRCHQAIFQRWSRSTHGRAGGPPTEARLIPPTKQRRFRFSDARVELVREGGGYAFVISDLRAKAGAPKTKVIIDGVVGAEAMIGGGAQAYLHRTSQGTVVHLPFEYSHKAGQWFCQRRETVGGRTEARWRPIDGQFPLGDCGWPPKTTMGYTNYNHCGNCHGSQIEAVFDPAAKAYRTRWTALHINCESCHGPGRRHVELMTAPPETHTTDIGLPALDLADKKASTEVCLACHASKRALAVGYLSGDRVEDYFTTTNMDLESQRDHHPDGRIADFGYQEGHLYSDCFQSGAMTCVDCHDPHGQTYRDPHGRPLPGRFDDGQCLGCHPAKGPESGHSGHGDGPRSPRCTDCHMPFTQHPAVPDAFRLTRSDHVIPIPRPGPDDDLGVKNACAHCHAAQGLGWQMSESKRLFGELKPHPTAVSTLQDVRSGRVTAMEWLLRLGPRPGPNGVIALTLFLADALQGELSTVPTAALSAVEALLTHPSLDLRAAAITSLLVLGEAHPNSRKKALTALGPRPPVALHGRVRRALLDLYATLGAGDPRRARVLEDALSRYHRATGARGAAVTVAKANVAVERGALHEAGQLFSEAAATPSLTEGAHGFGAGAGAAFQHHVRAGDMAMARRNPQEAVRHFSAAQALAPHDPAGKRGHWMSLLASERPGEALTVLDAYLVLVPSFTEGHLIRGRILGVLGRISAARRSLRTAARLRPDDPAVKAALDQLERADTRDRGPSPGVP